MNKKTKYLFLILSTLVILVLIQATYLNTTKSMSSEMLDKKKAFVKAVGLPDLAISTEATYIRHRSLSNLSSIYSDDGTLREYFASSYTISHSHTINRENR